MRPTVVLAAAAAALSLPVVPASAATVPTGPSGVAFYTPPSPLPGKVHGDLIRARVLPTSAKIPGATNRLVLHRSTAVDGRPIAVSGVVSLPKGKAPKGGWPVVSWAHGTTGIADRCAPSRGGTSAGSTAAAGANSYVMPTFRSWIARGYAVVRTDYEGLGTPGTHPYLVGRSAGRSVLDVVRAARKLDRRVSRRVVIAGHSQGGHAALWAASLARTWTPELDVEGTVAFAPASNLDQQAPLLGALTAPNGGLSGLISLIARGIDSVRPQLGVPSLMTPDAAALYPLTLERCTGELAAADAFGALAPSQLLREDADLAPLLAELAANDVDGLRIRTPVLVEQGSADATVFPIFTDALVASLKELDVPVTLRTVEGAGHGDVVTKARTDAAAWIAKRLR